MPEVAVIKKRKKAALTALNQIQNLNFMGIISGREELNKSICSGAILKFQG